MNVEKITALEQIKSTLGIAYKSAVRPAKRQSSVSSGEQKGSCVTPSLTQ